MSNTTTKVNSFIFLGYSLLASQATADNTVNLAVEERDIADVPSYQDVTENILPGTGQSLQPLIISNPASLRI